MGYYKPSTYTITLGCAPCAFGPFDIIYFGIPITEVAVLSDSDDLTYKVMKKCVVKKAFVKGYEPTSWGVADGDVFVFLRIHHTLGVSTQSLIGIIDTWSANPEHTAVNDDMNTILNVDDHILIEIDFPNMISLMDPTSWTVVLQVEDV